MLLRVALAFALIYFAALAAWWALPALGQRRWLRILIVFLTGMVSNLAAIVIPLDHKPVRFAAAVVGVLTASRIAIYFIEGQRATLGEYFRFISFGMLRPYLVFTREVQHASQTSGGKSCGWRPPLRSSRRPGGSPAISSPARPANATGG